MKTDRVVVTGSKTPHRAANYSSEQAAAIVCAANKSGFNGDNARRMHAATVAAEQARRDLDAGRITGSQADEIELRRQDAVINFMVPVPLLNMVISPGEKLSDMPPPGYGSVVLENTDLFTFQENGRMVIAVRGVAHNTGTGRVVLPPLTLRAIDEWDFALAGQSSLLSFNALDPGEAREFEIRFLNPPANTAEVYVHFAPPFLYRSRRDCDFFDPKTFDASATLGARPGPSAAPVGVSAGYSAAELNLLTQFFRRESEAAWRCETESDGKGRTDCTQRLYWRDMFAMSEAIDEAWVALAAEEATRRLPSDGYETDKAQASREAAVQRFRDLGARALARAGDSAADVRVAVERSIYGRDAAGLFVDISGALTNEGSRERRIDTLMVVFVDRMELPLSSVAIAVDIVLAPGQAHAFQQRIEAGAARGTAGVQLTFGERRQYSAPARIPPRDIPWQVRVGAMSRDD